MVRPNYVEKIGRKDASFSRNNLIPLIFGFQKKRITNQRTDGRMAGRAEGRTGPLREARTQLKSAYLFCLCTRAFGFIYVGVFPLDSEHSHYVKSIFTDINPTCLSLSLSFFLSLFLSFSLYCSLSLSFFSLSSYFTTNVSRTFQYVRTHLKSKNPQL